MMPRFDTIQGAAIWYCVIQWYSAIQCDTVRYIAIQYSATPYTQVQIIPYDTIGLKIKNKNMMMRYRWNLKVPEEKEEQKKTQE